jgi:diguanylate cyclase (GGDEF)-like protein
MPNTRYAFTPPKNRFLRWLTDPGVAATPGIASTLLGELFASPKAVLAGVANGLIVNLVALSMHRGRVFAAFIIVDVVLVVARIDIVRRAMRASAQQQPTPTDLYLIIASSWCALQGAMAFSAMLTGILALQLLAAASVMALTGPICARNYPAPRYAMMLVMFCFFPYILGAVSLGERLLLITIVQAPLFLLGAHITIKRFQSLAIARLLSEQQSHHRARHDALSGLLNRFGLMETEKTEFFRPGRRYIVFYIDLDGFKPINDSFGHQAGDAVLHTVAGRLSAMVRAGDIVARLGGDEFVILAPGMSPADAGVFAGRIVRQLSDEPYCLGHVGNVRVSASIGFACAPDDGTAADELRRKADIALYEAKAAGKGVYRRFMAPNRGPPAMSDDIRQPESRLLRADLRGEAVMSVEPDAMR